MDDLKLKEQIEDGDHISIYLGRIKDANTKKLIKANIEGLLAGVQMGIDQKGENHGV